jgi:hypothetical protein
MKLNNAIAFQAHAVLSCEHFCVIQASHMMITSWNRYTHRFSNCASHIKVLHMEVSVIQLRNLKDGKKSIKKHIKK